ncbi:MAG TPA: tyrosine-type recombinase/integrase [Nitrososphaeraceae archaeon]|nr:tyrosine-type recombinase/integrase [Nitrososphaeraceae archaeon]
MYKAQITETNKNRLPKYNIQSELLQKFIASVSIRNEKTAIQYHSRLLLFEKFVKEKYGTNIDKLIQQLKSNSNEEYDPYDILNDYCTFLHNNCNIGSVTFRDKIITVKTFLEFNDIEISPRKFKLKVRYPKTVFKHKEAIDKEDIIKILNGCSDLRLKTYVMLLASTGLRATEALSIRLKDLDIGLNSPAKLTIRGEYTKTKIDRYVFLTKEVVEQIKIWLDFKYRK